MKHIIFLLFLGCASCTSMEVYNLAPRMELVFDTVYAVSASGLKDSVVGLKFPEGRSYRNHGYYSTYSMGDSIVLGFEHIDLLRGISRNARSVIRVADVIHLNTLQRDSLVLAKHVHPDILYPYVPRSDY